MKLPLILVLIFLMLALPGIIYGDMQTIGVSALVGIAFGCIILLEEKHKSNKNL